MKCVGAGWLGVDSGCCSCSRWWPIRARFWEAQATCCRWRWWLTAAQEGACDAGRRRGDQRREAGAGVMRTSVLSSK